MEREKNGHLCSDCGRKFDKGVLIKFDGLLLCPDCLEEKTVTCNQCGDRIWRDDESDHVGLCQRCYDRYYTTCVDCGGVIHCDDAYYVDEDSYDARCYDCHTRFIDNQCIHDYYYRPEYHFYGSGERYLGIELEIDGAGESDSNAQKILEVANRDEERLYAKHDGSLSEGIELVSHPCTVDYHLNEMPWAEVMEKAKQLGYRSHAPGTCGLHFHINRTAFGATEEEQEASIARLLFLFELFWNELLKFSRRTQASLQQWARRYGLRSQPKEILDHAKNEFLGERYTAVNLTNRDTVELRMWRGTIRYSTFAATVILADKLIDCACYMTDEEVKNLSWTSFVAGFTQPEIITYLKERRLYINEAIDAEQEV